VNFVGPERTQLSFILVKPQAGVNPLDLTKRIEATTGLRARTSEQFQWDCVVYYLKNTGIPVNFGITIAIALIVGIVVAGQTFYIFTVENLKQFAALKAIGVTNWRITSMIVLQALAVGAMGFSIGSGLCAAFHAIMMHSTVARGMVLLWQSVIGTGVAILVVIIIASLISIRRVLVLEPAAVFRG
jgi:putative ABC transport system permease protein